MEQNFFLKLLLLHIIILPLALCFLSSCQDDLEKKRLNIDKEVAALNELEDKKEFLENLLYESQMIRRQEDNIIKSFGYNSSKHKSQQKQRAKLELVNIMKIDSYFDQYGYPSRAELGQYAAYAPWVIMFHSLDFQGIKKEHFKFFYGAYTFNDLPGDLFSAYLKQYYKIEKGKTFEYDKMDTHQDLINRMMTELGYEI